MGEMIKLLPDSIANQIAAGEVIQRPASVVKELMENAIDAEASEIKIIVKNAGKTLIQVIDNGNGMSEIDARMSFERHATSKIRSAQDLFTIRTMGFRGEALASVAAIAQVEMKTCEKDAELGTRLVIDGSVVKKQEVCQSLQGTHLTVKNLFYNVPARRKFLKSDPVEMKHLLDEFQHIAIAHENVALSLYHNENEIYHLPASNLRQRILGIFGKRYNEHLVPIEEDASYVKIEGFIGKPKLGKKTRGDQFLFVNQRYIKSPYLNHAIKSAYEDILSPELHAFYVIFLEIDPAKIDVNVHPTKEQIKFEDERLIYNYVRVAVRHALGKYSIVPTMDFNQLSALEGKRQQPSEMQKDSFGSLGKYEDGGVYSSPATSKIERDNLKNWEKVFENLDGFSIDQENVGGESSNAVLHSQVEAEMDDEHSSIRYKAPVQVHDSYLIAQIKSGIMVIDQQAAHERILFEKYLTSVREQKSMTQKTLFPSTLKLSPADAEITRNVLPFVNQMGFEVEDFGQETIIIHGVPAHMKHDEDPVSIFQEILERYKKEIPQQGQIEEKVAKSMAVSTAQKRGKRMEAHEMELLIDALFACENPYKSPAGRNCFITIELSELVKRLTTG